MMENQEHSYETIEQEAFEAAAEQPEAPRSGPDAAEASVHTEEPQKKKKASPVLLAVVFGIIFVVLYAAVNIGHISATFSSILDVFTPILLGIGFAYLLNPLLKIYEFKVYKKIKNKHVLRALSMVSTYLTVILVIAAFLLLLIPQLIDSVTLFATQFDSYVENIVNILNNFIANLMENEKYRDLIDPDQLINTVTQFLFESEDLLSGLMNYVGEYAMGLFTGVKNAFLALFISIYILSSKERLKAQTAKFATAVFPASKSRRFFKYLSLCDRTFGSYFIGMLTDALFVGVLCLIVFSIFRLPYALLISVIVAVTNIIPVFGPFLGAIPSFLIILIVDPGKAILFLVLILIIQQIDGNIIAPKILGNSTGISSLAVVIAIILMGTWFGLVGMVIGVPVFAVGISIVKELLDTRLRAKNKPTDTAEYYDVSSLVDPHERHQSLINKIFNAIADLIKKLIAKLKKKKNADTPADGDGSASE